MKKGERSLDAIGTGFVQNFTPVSHHRVSPQDDGNSIAEMAGGDKQT
jgi:hypothetical protein